MVDDAQTPSDSVGNDSSTPGEVETPESQLMRDGSRWIADEPADAELTEQASTLPDYASMMETDGKLGDPVLDAHAVSNAAIDRARRPSRQPPALIAVATTMIVVLLLTLVLTTFAHGKSQTRATTSDGTVTTTADDMSTATDVTTAVPTTTAASTSTVGSGGEAGGTGGAGGAGGTGGTGTPPGTTSMYVTGLSLTVDRSSVNGTCDQGANFFNFTLTVSIAPGSQGGLVPFIVVPSDSLIQQISSDVDFGTVDTSETTTFGENIPAEYGDGTTHWVQVQITSPNAVSSQKVSFEADCVRQVTSVTASVTPNVWNAPCARTQTFTFTFTITLTPGPIIAVTVDHNTSSGFGDYYPPSITFNPVTSDVITYSVTGTLYSPTSDGSNGTYWQSITVTSPTSVASNQATITEAC